MRPVASSAAPVAPVLVRAALKITRVPAGSVPCCVAPAWSPAVVGSRTVTVKDAAPVLPAASAAEHRTVVVPYGASAPETAAHATGTASPRSSTAVTLKVASAPAGP